MTDIVNEENNTVQLPEEEQNTVVTDNGTTYESQESSIIAKEEADRAKQWAEESERQANISTQAKNDAITAKNQAVSAKNAAVEAKNYAESAITDTNLITVATDLQASPSKIKTVANNITNVNTVAGISSSVTAVANNSTNINAVNSNKTNINTVSNNIPSINTVVANITDIQNASSNAQKAKDWATKMNGLVDDEDYSAKYYADQAKQAAAGAVVDNISINRNTDGELQTIGVINQNAPTTAIKTWTGTKAQYNAIITKDINTIYICTDVGEIYLGTTKIVVSDNEIVHKTRDEIISGNITFTGSTHYKTDIAYTETPSVNKYGGFGFVDKNDSEISSFYAGLYTNGTGLAGFNLKNKSGNTAILCLRYNASGTFYTEAPTPTENTNTSKQIDTVGARNTKLANYLPLSGGALTGGLTITKNAPNVILRNTEITKGTGASKLTPMNFNDKDGKSMGVVRHQYGTNKNSIMELLAYKANSNSDTQAAALSITYPASGDPYAKAPASDESGSILTTVNKSKAQNGYFKLGNGLIIQWGTTSSSKGATQRTVNLPTAFSNTNYGVSVQGYTGGSSSMQYNSFFVSSKSTTNFICKSDANENIAATWVAIGY